MALINPLGTLARASSRSMVDTATGLLTTVGNDLPQFDSQFGLLVEGQRTNSIRNPRGEGYSAGSEPTNWLVTASGNGLTMSRAGSGIESGLPYVDYRWTGTTSTITSLFIYSEALTGIISAASGNTFAQSFFAKLVAGSWPVSGTQTLAWRGVDSGGSLTSDYALVPISAPTSAPLGTRSYRATRTMNGATTAWLTGGWRLDSIASGTAVDVTIRFSAPQIEQAPFASSPILPPVGTPGVTTRLSDSLPFPLSTLGIGSNGACTFWAEFMLPQAAVTDAQFLLQLDDGTDSNRLFVRNFQGGLVIVGGFQVAGSGTDAPGVNMTAGALFRLAGTVSAGRLAYTMNGGAVNAVTGGPTSGLTTLRLGNNAGGNRTAFGYVRRFGTLPYAVSDADLPLISL